MFGLGTFYTTTANNYWYESESSDVDNETFTDIKIKINNNYLKKSEKNMLYNSHIVSNIKENKELKEFINKMRMNINNDFIDIYMSGKTFNQIYTNKFVKFTNEYCADYEKNIYFVDGINTNEQNISFYDNNELLDELVKQSLIVDHYIKDGEIYYFNDTIGDYEKYNVYNYIANSNKYIWSVNIPDNAKIHINANIIESNIIIMKNKKPLTQHIISTTFDMLNNTDDINEIAKINYFTKFVKEPIKIDLIYKCALMKNMDIFDMIPEENKNNNIYIFMASMSVDSFDKIKYNISSDILQTCVEKNINIYKYVANEQKTASLTNYVLDKDILLYEFAPDTYKTVDNTLLYLQKCNNIDYVPKSLLNDETIINKLVENPNYLEYISFKHKTYIMCRNAVHKQGTVLKDIPRIFVDYLLCLDAVINDFNAYQYVPLIYRTDELKEKMVCCHPCSYILLNEYDITNNIIMILLTNKHLQVLNTTNINIQSLIALNIIDYYNCCPSIISVINTDIISTPNALYIVKSDISTYKYFPSKHGVFSFVSECVKYGVNFNELVFVYDHITHDVLIELVEARATIIYELPYNMLSDKLYMIALKHQVISLSDISEEYHTDELISYAYNNIFNNDFIDITDII